MRGGGGGGGGRLINILDEQNLIVPLQPLPYDETKREEKVEEDIKRGGGGGRRRSITISSSFITLPASINAL